MKAILAFVVFQVFGVLFFGAEQFFQTEVIGLSNGLIFALVALGYTLVYGIIELINFAHGDVFMLGSMVAFALIGPGARSPARPDGGHAGPASRSPSS